MDQLQIGAKVLDRAWDSEYTVIEKGNYEILIRRNACGNEFWFSNVLVDLMLSQGVWTVL